MTDLVQLREVCEFTYGDSLREDTRHAGDVPVYGSNGIIGWHDEATTHGPTIIVGRKGSIGEVNFSVSPCFPIDTTYYVEKTKKPCDLRWLYYALVALDLTKLNKSAAVPGLNRDDAYEQKISFPPLPEQRRIAALLDKANHLRRTRRYAAQLSDTFLQAVFVRMFGDPVRNPMGWDGATVDDVVAFSQYGTSEKNNRDGKGYPILAVCRRGIAERGLPDSMWSVFFNNWGLRRLSATMQARGNSADLSRPLTRATA